MDKMPGRNGVQDDAGGAGPSGASRPQSAPAPRAKKKNTGDAVVVTMGRVQNIMHQFGTLKKIKTSSLRRNIRDCELYEQDRRRVNTAVAEVIVALDFKFFEKLSLGQVLQVVDVMTVQKSSPGEYVFRKGQIGHHFYSIFSGEVDIILQEGARPVATLGPGQSFGELALLNDAPRLASVRCKTAVIMGLISRQEFTAITGQQRAIAEATCYATISLTVPFSEYTSKFKRKMASIMEQRRIVTNRQVCEGSNLAEQLIITRTGAFEITADVRLNMAQDVPRIVHDKNGVAQVVEGEKIEKTFDSVPIMKLDRRGLIFGLGEIMMGVDSPGVRDWVMDAYFEYLYMFARGEGGGSCFVIPRKAFKGALKEDIEMKRYCERLHELRYRHNQTVLSQICMILNKQDFGQKKSYYLLKIFETIEQQNIRFYEQVEWRYFLEDIRERGREKETLKHFTKNKGESHLEVMDREATRDKTWDYI